MLASVLLGERRTVGLRAGSHPGRYFNVIKNGNIPRRSATTGKIAAKENTFEPEGWITSHKNTISNGQGRRSYADLTGLRRKLKEPGLRLRGVALRV